MEQVDDTPSSASSGITLSNGDKAWDFDLVIPGYGNVNVGEGELIRFIAGPTVGTGVWCKGTDYDAVRDTTDTDKINFTNTNGNLEGMLYETNAFVDGLVPYGAPPNYNLQSFTYNGLTADENESLTEYQGLWRAWDWTWVEGDGDGVIYTKSDWTLHKNTDGSFYVVKTVDGFTSGNFSPDANGIATITFNWNEHTAIMFKPPA